MHIPPLKHWNVSAFATACFLVTVCPLAAQTVTYVESFGSNGTADGQFSNPFFIAVNPSDGTTYVGDNLREDVQIFNAAGDYVGEFIVVGPRGIAIRHATGEVYAAGVAGNHIGRYSAAGVNNSYFGEAGSGNGQLNSPRGIAINQNNGDVWVCDNGNQRVQRFSASGVYLGQFGSPGSGDGQFNSPTGIAIHPVTGDIFVVDTGNDRVQRFSGTGVFEAKWGSDGSGNGQFLLPYGIAIDSLGRVYISDTDLNRVQRFDSNGNFQLAFGSSGSGPGELNSPRGLALLPGGDIAVIDVGNSRISRWRVFDPIAPTIRTVGKKRFSTRASLRTLKGTAADVNGDLARVEVKVGKAGFRTAKGTARWSYRVRLKAGKNSVQVRALDDTGLTSPVSRITILRR